MENPRFRLQRFCKTVAAVWFGRSVFLLRRYLIQGFPSAKPTDPAGYRIPFAPYSLVPEPNKTRIQEKISEAALPDTKSRKRYRSGNQTPRNAVVKSSENKLRTTLSCDRSEGMKEEHSFDVFCTKEDLIFSTLNPPRCSAGAARGVRSSKKVGAGRPQAQYVIMRFTLGTAERCFFFER